MNTDFFNRSFLENHIRKTLDFYHPHVIDSDGGYYQYFRDDGSVYNASTRHLVSSTRFIFNFAMADRYFPELNYKSNIQHGLKYLEESHYIAETGGYAWVIEDGGVADATNHCYGLAFIIVAASTALIAGVEDARETLDKAWKILEQYFWDEKYGLYRDEATHDFSEISNYHGQNSNMHCCEALIWAYEATGSKIILERAEQLAKNITCRQAAKADGLIWEHYNEHWELDWDYNKNDPKNLFRPWGFQPGHHTEWAKLLLILNRHSPKDWYVSRAAELFDRVLVNSWDNKHGGIFYSFAPDNSICDTDKYFWVQAESFAAAALLLEATKDSRYKEWYQKIWAYSWEHMIDHEHGAWFRILTHSNEKFDNLKSPAGKTDYHTMGACYEVLRGAPSLLT